MSGMFRCICVQKFEHTEFIHPLQILFLQLTVLTYWSFMVAFIKYQTVNVADRPQHLNLITDISF